MSNPRNYSSATTGRWGTWSRSTGTWDYFTFPNATRQVRSQSDSRRAKPSGKWIKPTSYSMTEWSENHAVGSYRVIQPGGSTLSIQSGQLGGAVTSPTSQLSNAPSNQLSESFDSTIANRALLKIRTKAKDQDINLAQAYAERAQVSSMAVSTLNKLYRCATHLHKKQWKKACADLGIGGKKPLTKKPSDQWLELQYGWKPLLQDVHGAVSALEKRNSDDWKVTVKARETVKRELNAFQGNTASGNRCITNHRSLMGSYARIDMVPESQALISASQLGLTNPAVVAWELVPFSFVADWFVPVGEFLGQFDALAGWKVLGFSQSNFTRVEWSWAGVSSTSGSGSNVTNYVNSWNSRRRFVSLNRTAGTVVPFAVYPRIKNPFSEAHGWNAIALLAQALSNL